MTSENELYNKSYPDVNYQNNMFNILEGKSRPDFFKGVCMVVAKLFDIIKPTHSFFGEKDFQQLRIIEQMTLDLNYDIKIMPCKIIREANGLAMSSRNQHLSSSQKEKAGLIFETLNLGTQLIQNGNKNIIEVYDVLTKNLEKESDIRLDYLKIINYDTLIECEDMIENQFAICIAAYIGDIRLIDNINYLFSESSSI